MCASRIFLRPVRSQRRSPIGIGCARDAGFHEDIESAITKSRLITPRRTC
jgi:hypothetical protein